MLQTSAGVECATFWSPVGRSIQLSHGGRQQKDWYCANCMIVHPTTISAQHWACLEKISADNALKHFSYFPQKIRFEETICKKCQILFSGENKNWRQFARNIKFYFRVKNKKNIIKLSSVEFTQRVGKFKTMISLIIFIVWSGILVVTYRTIIIIHQIPVQCQHPA